MKMLDQESLVISHRGRLGPLVISHNGRVGQLVISHLGHVGPRVISHHISSVVMAQLCRLSPADAHSVALKLVHGKITRHYYAIVL